MRSTATASGCPPPAITAGGAESPPAPADAPEDELDVLAVDEAALLLSVALAAQPPTDEVPSAERARLLGHSPRAAPAAPRRRSPGPLGGRRSQPRDAVGGARPRLAGAAGAARTGRSGGRRARVDRGGEADVGLPWRGIWCGAGRSRRREIDSRGGEPWQIKEALAAAERACLVAGAAGPVVERLRSGPSRAAGPRCADGRPVRVAVRTGGAPHSGGAGRQRLVEGCGGRRRESPASGCTSAWRRSPPATTWTSTCPRPGSSSPSKPGPFACASLASE